MGCYCVTITMNIYKIYYDDVVHATLLDIDCDEYNVDMRRRISNIVSSKVLKNIDRELLDKQDGVIGFARVPTMTEFEREDRVIKVIPTIEQTVD